MQMLCLQIVMKQEHSVISPQRKAPPQVANGVSFWGTVKLITANELMDDGEYEEILEDMGEEGEKFDVLDQLINGGDKKHETHQRSLRPSLQSNPEVD
ncbi:hypothetical protein LOK49_Contig15G00033 [Camellia lanceoleosa]|nr:hypothetical protein LOK49_Contig15G00033 [Camellia lanceoleosa]